MFSILILVTAAQVWFQSYIDSKTPLSWRATIYRNAKVRSAWSIFTLMFAGILFGGFTGLYAPAMALFTFAIYEWYVMYFRIPKFFIKLFGWAMPNHIKEALSKYNVPLGEQWLREYIIRLENRRVIKEKEKIRKEYLRYCKKEKIDPGAEETIRKIVEDQWRKCPDKEKIEDLQRREKEESQKKRENFTYSKNRLKEV